MSIFTKLRLKTKKTLIQIYGPPELEESKDPIVQVDKEYDEEVIAEQAAEAKADESAGEQRD